MNKKIKLSAASAFFIFLAAASWAGTAERRAWDEVSLAKYFRPYDFASIDRLFLDGGYRISPSSAASNGVWRINSSVVRPFNRAVHTADVVADKIEATFYNRNYRDFRGPKDLASEIRQEIKTDEWGVANLREYVEVSATKAWREAERDLRSLESDGEMRRFVSDVSNHVNRPYPNFNFSLKNYPDAMRLAKSLDPLQDWKSVGASGSQNRSGEVELKASGGGARYNAYDFRGASAAWKSSGLDLNFQFDFGAATAKESFRGSAKSSGHELFLRYEGGRPDGMSVGSFALQGKHDGSGDFASSGKRTTLTLAVEGNKLTLDHQRDSRRYRGDISFRKAKGSSPFGTSVLWAHYGKTEDAFLAEVYLEDYHLNYSQWAGQDIGDLVIEDRDNVRLTLDRDRLAAILRGGDVADIVSYFKLDWNQKLAGVFTLPDGRPVHLDFDWNSRILSGNFDGYGLSMRLATDGFFKLDTADRRLRLDIGFPERTSAGWTVPLRAASYHVQNMRVDFSGTHLDLDLGKNILGLYGDRYILEADLFAPAEMEARLKAGFQDWDDLSFGKEGREKLIRSTLKDVRVNMRELRKHVYLGDPQWDDVMALVAFDVGEFSMSSDQIVDIVNADKPGRQLYTFLQAVSRGSADRTVNNAEKNAIFGLGNSIMKKRKTFPSRASLR
ncbi:MAG: hypothetical protein HYT89_02325 [Candidatus Omnitrophica bacterium]|nr:hypothetical protein [Candidatus Omnitrophota bacterium]